MQPMIGTEVAAAGGTHRALHRFGRRLHGRTIEDIAAAGKQLIISFEGDWALRTHLGMTGSWHLYRPEQRWRLTRGKARVILQTVEYVAVCFAAPTVDVGPAAVVMGALRDLGPDVLDDTFDATSTVERARTSRATVVADLLLDQQVAAGIGNVYKNEILFLERLHPTTAVAGLSDREVTALFDRGRRLMAANRDHRQRSTTGARARSGRSWVYRRAGEPCRRCGTPISSQPLGFHQRVTYWCPSCQPYPKT